MSEVEKRIEEKYLRAKGVRCPICNSKDIEGGKSNFDGDYCTLEVTCSDCDAEWRDIYTLSGIEWVEPPQVSVFCPKCGQHFGIHEDDGSCIDDSDEECKSCKNLHLI
jgi:hypothetical protein